MTLQVTLVGGPPWGLRVSHDEELRPVVAKLIPAGRADSAGLRIGDLIEEVNDNPVVSTSQAQTQIQESKGELRLRVGRSSAGYHATVAREKLSNSLQGSPIAERKFPSHQNPSLQPRTNPNFRQIRLDVQGVKGTADSKRRMFEQLSAGKPPPPATDRLLQRKIQMGFHAGVPSESTTGYGSVGGDFAGGASGRTTPMSSILAEEDERTLHEDALRLPNGIPEEMHPTEMRIESPGPSQWAMKTETHSVAPADGTVEVPRPRSVAALRQALTDKLELKSPSGSTPTEGRRTPSSWSNVRVFEGIEEDPSKPVFGRVLDGPVAPEKYFQGVPPPSYNWTSQASSSVAAPVSPAKPPVPPPSIPPKPPKPSVEHDFNGNISSNGARNSFLNNIAARAEEMEPSPTFSDDFGRGLYYDNSYGRSPLEESSMTRSTTTTTTETEQPVEPAQSVEPPEDPTSIPSGLWPSRGSMDLESSQLLKSKSPSPYSSGTADHYATIRRAPTPVKVEVLEPQVERKPYSSSTTNDSGYGDALSPRDTLGFDCYSMGSTMPASSADQTIDTLSIESSRPERPESLISTETDAPPPLRPVSNEPEMASWYRDMFKKMHKIELTDPGRPSPREGSPSAVSTISRPHTPTTLVSRPPSRFECEITPRRARSVGRVIEPADRAAWERSRTSHFHLPSYAFRDEDSRALLCGCSTLRGATRACMRCGRPRKAPSWGEIDFLYKALGTATVQKERQEERLQSRIARRAISDRLDETARELEMFILQLGKKDSEKEESPTPAVAEEIAELKRLSKEEIMLRQKAERLQEELEEQRQRRHGYLPSSAPSLQKNMDRFEGLMNEYCKEASPSRNSPANVIRTATAVYGFAPKSARELPLNKGDIVRIHRQIDSNWLEGERNGKSGIFPASYVQMNQETDPRMRMRAVYPFTARNSNEMSLRLGQIVTWRRDIDANWAEGANHIGEIGIFPKCYVRPAEEEQEQPQAVIPDRPKTPKITFDLDREEEWRQPVAHPVQDHPVYFEKPEERRHAPVREHIPVREHTVPIETSREEEWRQPIVRDHSIQIESRDKFYRDQAVREQSAPARHPAFSVDEPVAVHNGFHGGSGGRNAVEHMEINTYQHRHDDFRPNGLPHNPSSFEPSSSNQQRASTAPTTPHAGSSLANMIPKGSEVYRATFAYVPEKEDELELRIDDIVFVVEKCDDGWFIGTSLRDGRFGTFPGNYVVRH